MPRSKRAQVVHLTQVQKKGKELSQRLYAGVQAAAEQYAYAWVFDVSNMRNVYLKDVREEWSDSRIFFGKTRVMAKALGTTPATSHLPGTHLLSPYLEGNVGLLFTSHPPEVVTEYFDSFTRTDYARAGTKASRSFTIPQGIVYSRAGEVSPDDDLPVPHSVEAQLRKLGVPTRLVQGKVLIEDEGGYSVCREGDTLTSAQTALLKFFGVATADFRVRFLACWDKASETVTVVDAMEED